MTETRRGGREQFLLFFVGEPHRYAEPSSGNPSVSVRSFGGAPTGSASWGMPESADAGPGQAYGEEARTARMVLEIAERLGVTVRTVDLNNPGEDALLARENVRTDDLLPLMVGPDGSRLEGESEFLPSSVERFLRGRR